MKTLLITPPLLQPNTAYPATAYLKGYLTRRGYDVEQYDLSVELLGEIFSEPFLEKVFARHKPSDDANIARIHALRKAYTETIGPVMAFLRDDDPTLASRICGGDFLPQAGRFEDAADVAEVFGWMGTHDCARYLATLYLQDISDYIRATVTEHFEIVKYAEHIALSLAEFSSLEMELTRPANIIEQCMTELLRAEMERHRPDFVCFTVPFPGNLLPALRCGQYIKSNFPGVMVVLGGGYPTTELRHMSDKGIFKYADYIVLDDGEVALERILSGGDLIDTYTADGFHSGFTADRASRRVSHADRGCPDVSGLPFDKYFSLCEVTNPMHRLWSDGRWNKMMMAHGCYWGKCAFCDTSLDYIACYDGVAASVFVDWMEAVARRTGSTGFHFVDEAAPPRLLRDVSIELIRRGLKYTWWTNIRFEAAFTGDLCRLMAAAGCVAVSGGLEVASDRLLTMIDKGITVEQATIAMRNFYYAGVMVHTYLMYGLPTQTLQESVDAAEVVRQMFEAELIDSAFWHRYAMTLHSRSGQTPEEFGVRRKGGPGALPNPFANNEVFFSENRGYSLPMVGEALTVALANYMAGAGIDRPVHKWFNTKVPPTTVERSLISDHLIKPDRSRIFDEHARLVWVGAGCVERTADGILLRGIGDDKHLALNAHDADFLMALFARCGDLARVTTLGDAKTLYAEFSDEPFAVLYHSKKWDKLREYGLWQV